jgi:hypothetical protein
VNQWYHVGSKNERLGRTGFAHLFEHMMFQGSKDASEDYFVYAEKAGANLLEGGVNGTTNQDRTNYFATVPLGKPREPAVARVRPARDADGRAHQGKARQPARRRQERATARAREHARTAAGSSSCSRISFRRATPIPGRPSAATRI